MRAVVLDAILMRCDPSPDASLTGVWIALDDAPADGGAMRYLPTAPDGGPGSMDRLEIAAARAACTREA